MQQRPAGTLLEKIMIKSDDSMDFGNGEVQFPGYERDRVLRDKGQRLLYGMQNGQKCARQLFETRAGINHCGTFNLAKSGRTLDLDWYDSPRNLLFHDSPGKFIDISDTSI